MSWQMVVLIAIGASVVLSIPVALLMWKVFKRFFGVFDDISSQIHHDQDGEVVDRFAEMEARVRKMTGPGPNPFHP